MAQNSKVFGDGVGHRSGVYKLNNYSAKVLTNAWWSTAGQEEFINPGTYTWVCPPAVYKVSAVCIGGGGGGAKTWNQSGGGGAGLGWKNDIPVVPGESYTLVVGSGGARGGAGESPKGGMTYFISAQTVAGGGGAGSNGTANNTVNPTNVSSHYTWADGISAGLQYDKNGGGGGYSGDGGGRGGNNNQYSGAGCAGYLADGGSGNAGAGSQSGGSAAAGGYYSSTYGVSAGGGTGIYGLRTDVAPTSRIHGTAADYGTESYGSGCWDGYEYGPSSVGGGMAGSQRTGIISGVKTGWDGCSGENPWGAATTTSTWGNNANNVQGGFPGGGGGGSGTSYGGGKGGNGAARLIWAGEMTNTNRSYPQTNVEDIV